MRRKWARVLAAALAVTMAIPANLPANAKAAEKTITKDNTQKQSSESTSYDYEYLSLGNNMYLRYITDYVVNPGQQITLASAIVTGNSGTTGDVTVLNPQPTEYKFQWEVKQGSGSGFTSIDGATTNAYVAAFNESWSDSGENVFRLKVTDSKNSTYITDNIFVSKALPYSDTGSGQRYFYKTLGDSVTLNSDIRIDAGYTAEYAWEHTVKQADGTFAPSVLSTVTTPNYTFTLSDETLFGDYTCTISIKDASGTVVSTAKRYYSVDQDSGLRLKQHEKVIRQPIDSSVTLTMDGLTYDTAKYQIRYDWYKGKLERNDIDETVTPLATLTNNVNTYSIPALTADTDGSYTCVATIYKTEEDKLAARDEVDYEVKHFDVYAITGLWVYPGETYIKTPINGQAVLKVNATNLFNGTGKYPITYSWYQGTSYVTSTSTASAISSEATYNIQNITKEQFGAYHVNVSDGVNATTINYMVAEDDGWKLNTPTENILYKNIGEAVDLTVNIGINPNYPNITYTWTKNNRVINGAEGAKYSFTLAKDSDFGTYTCTATNGISKSTVKFIIARNDNFYVERMTNYTQYVKEGSSASFKVRAHSDDAAAAFDYQWSFASEQDFYTDIYAGTWTGEKIPGNNTDTLNVSNVSLADFGRYRCVVTNKQTGATRTLNFYLYLQSGVELNYTTDSVLVREVGQPVSMGVAATPAEGLSYVWAFTPEQVVDYSGISDSVLDDGTILLEGYTGATLDIAALEAGQYGTYTCNALYNGVRVGYKEFIVKKDSKSYLELAYATDSDQEVVLGSSVTLGVNATSKEGRTITYQWYQGSYAIVGATAATYTIASVRKCDFGSYYCVVSDGVERTGKIPFSVSQKSAMTYTWAGGDADDTGAIVSKQGTVGKALKLALNVVEDPAYPANYEWYFCKDREDVRSFYVSDMIAGATGSSYNIAAVNKDTVGYYTCRIRVPGTEEYTYVTFYVYFNTNLVVKTSKTVYTANVGDKVSMSATVSSKKKYPATFQWYFYDKNRESVDGKKWVAISGATKAKYEIASVAKENYGSYRLDIKTDGESQSVKYTLTKKAVFAISNVTASTEATMVGGTVTLNSTVVAPKDAKVTYQWYAEDGVTGDEIKAKNTKGKNAASAKVSVKAPNKITPQDSNSDPYRIITYRVVAKTVINGKTVTRSSYVNVMVVQPAMGSKAPQSAHNYKAAVKYPYNYNVDSTIIIQDEPSGKVLVPGGSNIAEPDESTAARSGKIVTSEETEYVVKDTVSAYGYQANGNVGKLKVTFDKKTSVNKEDYMYVIDGNGKATKYTGSQLKKKTVTLAGKKFAVVIVSTNPSAKSYGFAVSKIKTVKDNSTPSKLTLGVKEKHKINGVLTKAQAKKAKYKTSKKKVAAVSKKGVITAKKPGKAKITIKVNKKKVKTITVTVKKAPKKVKVAKKKVVVKRGKSATVKYSLKPSKSASYSMSVANAKTLKKAKISASVYDGKVSISVGKKTKKKTYKVQISTYNKKKATIKVKVK